MKRDTLLGQVSAELLGTFTLIAVGDSRDEALALARAAANEIRFVVE